MAKVLTCIKTIKRGSYTYQLLGHNKAPTYVHINNTRTNKDSVIVPINVLHELLYQQG